MYNTTFDRAEVKKVAICIYNKEKHTADLFLLKG